MSGPDLSVVIPTRNDAEALTRLLPDLARQEGIVVEVIVADGGSRGPAEELCREANRTGLAARVVRSAPGRGRQMNRGAREARAEDLLFLHADSGLGEAGLLARARARLEEVRARRGSPRVAGHFGLRFQRSESTADGAYYFYEAKSTLNRRGCINGDQGFWLSGTYFRELGGFDESLPYLEDHRLSERIFATGDWVTLAGPIQTSARRFEAEGLRQRQTLNALLRAAEVIGLQSFFGAAVDAYRPQEKTGRLRVKPFLRITHGRSLADGYRCALGYWYRAGGYVAGNAWQLAFALDCRRNRRRGLPPGEGPTPWLNRFDRWGAPLMSGSPARLAGCLAAALWFYGSIALPER